MTAIQQERASLTHTPNSTHTRTQTRTQSHGKLPPRLPTLPKTRHGIEGEVDAPPAAVTAFFEGCNHMFAVIMTCAQTQDCEKDKLQHPLSYIRNFYHRIFPLYLSALVMHSKYLVRFIHNDSSYLCLTNRTVVYMIQLELVFTLFSTKKNIF